MESQIALRRDRASPERILKFVTVTTRPSLRDGATTCVVHGYDDLVRHQHDNASSARCDAIPFHAIAAQINDLTRRGDGHQWTIGKLVTEAVRIGVPGQKTGADAILKELASHTAYEFNTLRAYRATYVAWLDDAGNLDIIEDVSFAVHQAVKGIEKKREFIAELIELVGGNPLKLTVAIAEAAIQRAAKATLPAQPKIFDENEPYRPLNEAFAAMWEQHAKVVGPILERPGGVPAYAGQRQELLAWHDRLRAALDASEKALLGYTPAPALGAGHDDDLPNPLAGDPEARREYVNRIVGPGHKADTRISAGHHQPSPAI